MSGTEAAATLSLEIDTHPALASLDALEAKLLTFRESLPGKMGNFNLNLSLSTTDANKQLAAFLGQKREIGVKVNVDLASAKSQLASLAKDVGGKTLAAPTINTSALEESIKSLTGSMSGMTSSLRESLATVATYNRTVEDTARRASESNKGLAESHNKAATAAKANADATNKFTLSGNDAHAMARGLSGSLGTLWMTYGAIVPLMAGAALGAGFKSAAKEGAEFAYQLTFVKALGGESAQSIAEIGTAALTLSKNSMYGPVELANGLRMLSQAGLNAKDSMAALPSVMQLATVGEMSMEQAAVTLVGVMNAFGESMTSLPHIGDMFAKAAALSQTSVSGMTEAMKAASVVHDQYGASMEDTATAVTLLAKVNITGTAAGTSYRNMLKDLYTPSKEAAEVMKQLGIETRDASGNLRDFPDIMRDLNSVIKDYTQGSQTDILGKIFSERGGKEAIQMLNSIGTTWDDLKSKISNSDGFMSSVTSELEMTTKGRFQQALNTMESNLISAFDASEGSVRGLADSLKSLADSPEFVAWINAIVGSMASLAKIVVDFLPVLTAFGAAWGGLKVLGLIGTGAAAATSGLSALAAAIESVSVSIKVMGIASLGTAITRAGDAAAMAGSTGIASLASALLSLPIAAVVAGLGAIAYGMYELVYKTADSVKSTQSFIDALTRQNEKTSESIRLLKEKNQLQRDGTSTDVDAAKAQLAALDAQIAKARETTYSKDSGTFESVRAGRELGDLTKQRVEVMKQLGIAEKNQAELNAQGLISVLQSTADQVAKLKLDAEHQGKSLSTAQIDSVIKAYSGTTLNARETRALKEQLDRLIGDLQREALGSGTKTFDAGGAGKSDKSAVADKYRADIEALKGYIANYKAEYSQFTSETAKLHAEGSISEIQMLTANWADKNALLEAEMGKQREIIARAGKEKNKSADVAAAKNALAALLAAQERGAAEYEAAVIQSKTKTNDTILALEVSLGLKLETERDRALTVMQGQYAKALQEALNNGDVDLVEKLGKIKEASLQAADIKDVANSINSGLSSISVGLSALGSDVDKLEADMERDGGWISRIMNTSEITTLINERLPALREELERLKAELAAMPEGSEDSREALKIQKDIAKAQKEVDKFGNYVPKVWKDTVSKIDSTFHDGFAAIFSKGKTDWNEFGRSLAASFKTTVVDAIYQMLARPFVMNVVASVSGTMGVNDLASAAESQGSMGSLGNIASLGSNTYSLVNGGGAASGLYNSFALSGAGSAIGLSSVGSGLATAGGAVVNTTTLAGVNAAAGGVVQTAGLTSLGSTIGAAIPYVGWAIAAIAAISSMMGKGGGPQTAGDAFGTFSDSDFSFAAADRKGDPWFTSSNANSAVESIVKPLGVSVAGLIKSMGGSANGLSLNLGFSTDPNGTARDIVDAGVMDASGNYVYRNWRNAERGSYSTELQLETQRMMVAAVRAADVSQVYKDIAGSVDLYTASASELQTVLSNLTAITALRTAFDTLGFGADKLSKSLIDASGGTSTLASNLDSYYANFYSDSERQANTLKQISAAMAGLGLEMPTTREGFRALVDAQDLTTDSGQKTFAALMGLNGAFASVVPAAIAASTAISETMKALQAKTADLQIELLKAQGRTAEATAAQRVIDTADMTAAEVAVYDYNASLRKQIDALNAANEAMASLSSETKTLQIELLNAQGKTAEAAAAQRAIDTAGMNDAAVAVYDYNASLRKQIDALAAANEAMSSLQASTKTLQIELLNAQGKTAEASAAQRAIDTAGMNDAAVAVYDYNASLRAQISILTERSGLQGQFDELTMTSAQLLAKQRSALDESNRSLFDQINALKDKQAVDAKTASILETSATLAIALLRAQGNEQAALNAERAAAISGMSAEQVALYDANTATQARIDALNAEAEAAKAVASERANLQGQLDDLTMTSAELLNKQRAALDDSNRGLFDQINAIKAANAALADFAQQIEAIAATRSNVSSAKQGVVMQMAGFDAPSYWSAQQAILGAQFSSATSTTAKTDIAGKWQSAIASGLDAQIAALGVARDARIKALRDEAALADKNATTAKATAQSMASALSSISDYAKGLRTGNLSTLSPEDKLRDAGAEYSRLLAAAKGGDSTAAGKLTGASDTYLGLAKDYYASSSQYGAIFSQVEQSLSSIGAQASVYEAIANSTAATYDLAKATAAADADYQSSLLGYQEAALANYAALDEALATYQGGIEYRMDNQVIVLNDLGVKSDTIADRITTSQNVVTASIDRVNATTQQVNALLQQVAALLQQANGLAAQTASATASTASAATLAESK